MYNYSEFDSDFLKKRNAEFRAQVLRRISGALTEEEFKPLRLMNGLYLQLHAYMLRVAIPYGTLNSIQLETLAYIAEKWDRGYGHFTTRQNIQLNWPELTDVPDILDTLAGVNMHAVQTSGNTVRNVTADHYAGAAADEIEDPRPYAEWIRQWSTDHPEFQFLPRKFKIAVIGATSDRAVTKAHDLGLQIIKTNDQIGFRVLIGGGLGRTPILARELIDFVPIADLLNYIEAVVSVWNMLGRRDNKYKSRIKITVNEVGLENIKAEIEARFKEIKSNGKPYDLGLLYKIKSDFSLPELIAKSTLDFDNAYERNQEFQNWFEINTARHFRHDHAIVTISLKTPGKTPGDITSDQMRAVAKLARKFGYDEIRLSHEQNIIFPHVARADLFEVFTKLKEINLHKANIGLISDIIACPGMDYCALATARSIPIAKEIALHFEALKLENEIGPLQIKISGCVNACGHHHVGHIGILGLDRAGEENYQITLGGDSSETASLGIKLGSGFNSKEIIPAIDLLIKGYLKIRLSKSETFLSCYRRIGSEYFKDILYGKKVKVNAIH